MRTSNPLYRKKWILCRKWVQVHIRSHKKHGSGAAEYPSREKYPRKEQMTIRLPKELKEKIEKEADKRNISFNGMVNQLIYNGLEAIRQRK